jgi:hypothetical protein
MIYPAAPATTEMGAAKTKEWFRAVEKFVPE